MNKKYEIGKEEMRTEHINQLGEQKYYLKIYKM